MLADVRVERYELLGELATGGMATVYLGRQHGALGFTRTVAIKSMHPQFAKDDTFRAMFLDEAQLTAKIRHPNVVPTLDVVCAANKLLLVMEYIDGVALSTLVRSATAQKEYLPVPVTIAIVHDTLQGLHAAHELADETGSPLGVVHRDVSPHNIHVGSDGLARVLDFGIAKAAGRRTQTRTGEVKGKIAYMAPEQLFGEAVDRRADVYAAGVVLWEALTGRRLFDASNEGALVLQVTEGRLDPPSFFAEDPIPEALDRAVLKALARNPEERWATAEEMARAIAAAVAPAPRADVRAVVRQYASEYLDARARLGSVSTRTPGALEPDARAVLDVLTQQVHVTRSDVSPSSFRGSQPLLGIGILVAIAFVGVGVTAMLMARKAPPAAVDDPSAVGRASSLAAPPSPSASSSSASARPPAASASASSTDANANANANVARSAAPAGAVPAARTPTGGGRTPKAARSTGKTSTDQVPAKLPATAPRPDCSPPYTVDAEGHRHYKAECLERTP